MRSAFIHEAKRFSLSTEAQLQTKVSKTNRNSRWWIHSGHMWYESELSRVISSVQALFFSNKKALLLEKIKYSTTAPLLSVWIQEGPWKYNWTLKLEIKGKLWRTLKTQPGRNILRAYNNRTQVKQNNRSSTVTLRYKSARNLSKYWCKPTSDRKQD